ncbi:hypothetical protein GCM10023224_14680 [Streptomonospora halophila]|uniref:DUF397 domain-containing protein n=1 Tax=Streptomonospora halophila TaxID=427369 RepID=A0ABP9GB27_9ACTN
MRDRAFEKSGYSGREPNRGGVAAIRSAFRTSSYNGVSEGRLDVADLPAGAAVRDSKHPEAGHLSLPVAEWGAYLTAARAAEL